MTKGNPGKATPRDDAAPAGRAPEAKPALATGAERAARRLARFFRSTVALMQMMARACGHDHLCRLNRNDLTSGSRELAALAGIACSGAAAP